MMKSLFRWLCGKFPIVCSWCGAAIGESEVENSHGICQRCLSEQLEKI